MARVIAYFSRSSLVVSRVKSPGKDLNLEEELEKVRV